MNEQDLKSHDPFSIIRLAELRVDNFKGIKHFTLGSSGVDISVYGNNAAGKTTLADAFAWLLFGKDSQGRADFQLKTLSSTGEALHGLEHSVEAVLSIGEDRNNIHSFRKVYREKWVKRRGSADREFTGHTKDHFVDDVPVSQSEYEAHIAEIASEDIFQLLTNPVHFSERLHWQERRRLLLQVCGDISDAEVIDSSQELSALPEVLAGRTIENHRKLALARKHKINEQLQRIPVRIDEVSRGLPELKFPSQPGVIWALSDYSDLLKTRLSDRRKERSDTESERLRIATGGEIAEKTKQLREVEGEILAEINRAEAAANSSTFKLRQDLAKAQGELEILTRGVSRLELNLKDENEEIQSLEARMEERRAEWHEIDAESLDPIKPGDDKCPTCGQSLPEETVEHARSKAEAQFNLNKACKLRGITEEGKRYQARSEELKSGSEELKGTLAEHEDAIAKCKELIELHNIDIAKAKPKAEFKAFGRGLELVNQKAALEEEIEKLGEGNNEALEQVGGKLRDLDKRIAGIEAELSSIDQRRVGEERIEELKCGERQLALEYEELELQIHLLEEFTRRKVSMLTDRINDQFELARFKLFDIQVNGAIAETCEVKYDGVPWPGLNTGAQVNIGLDMIRTFSTHYGIAPPIFIDHSESVTELLETPGQQIRLITSKPDKTLRVEEETDERRSSEEVK